MTTGALHHAGGDEPVPAIPTLDSVAASFPVLLATLAPQPSVREIGVSDRTSGWNGVLAAQSALITYAVVRNPADLDDPANHVPISAELEHAIAHPVRALPPELVEHLRWVRFPSLWEAVETHLPRESWQSLPERLAEHMRNVVMNTFRAERAPDLDEPWTVTDAPLAERAEPATVVVDGVEVEGIRIDDEHVLGLAVELDDAAVTVVLPKHLLPLLRLELVRRPRPGAAEAA